jgi:toxin FitB
MILLDTNVVSALMAAAKNPKAVVWLDSQPIGELRISTITLHEIRYGIVRLPDGPQKSNLDQRLSDILCSELGRTILHFDEVCARHSAEAQAASMRATNAADVPDCLIAGIARAHGASVATRNTKDFKYLGVAIVDPWAAQVDQK